MTTTPNIRRLDLKIRRSAWIEDEHPRDRKGRFIEKGAWVRVWGGFMGRVFENVGGGRIEIVREADGKHVIVHRNYLTVVTRPDGSSPTDKRDANPAALPETAASADADVVPTPTVPAAAPDTESRNLFDLLNDWGDPELAATVRQAAADYSDALNNGTPDDEADERDGLLSVLDDVEGRYGYDHEDRPALDEALTLLREAATIEPPAPDVDFQPVSFEVAKRAAMELDVLSDEIDNPGYSVDGRRVTVTDPSAALPVIVEHRDIHEDNSTRENIAPIVQQQSRIIAASLTDLIAKLATDAKPGYSGRNEGGGTDGPNGVDRGAALPDAPAEGTGGDRGPADVLPDAGGRDAGADRGDGRGPEGTGPGGRADGGPAEPVRDRPVDGGVARDQGEPAAAGDVDDAPEPGGRGSDGGADGVLDGEGGTAGDALTAARAFDGQSAVVTRTDGTIIRGTVRVEDTSFEGPRLRVTYSTFNGPEDAFVRAADVESVSAADAPARRGYTYSPGDIPRLDAIPGTVRTSNGGEITGEISTHGYGSDLEVIVDGRRSQVPFGRVLNVTVDRQPEPDGFERDFGDLREVNGTVRLSNGGEASGVLTGSLRRGLSVRRDDGTNQWIDSSRILTVRRDPEVSEDSEESVTLDAADVERMRAYLTGESDEVPDLPEPVADEPEDETVTLDPAEVEATIAALRAELTGEPGEPARRWDDGRDVGDRVTNEFGSGTVTARTGRSITIAFDDGETMNTVVGTPGFDRITPGSGTAAPAPAREPRVLPPLPEDWAEVQQGTRLRFGDSGLGGGMDGTFVSYRRDRFGRGGTAVFVDDSGREHSARIYEDTKPVRATPNPEVEAMVDDLIANATVAPNADGVPTTYAVPKVGTWSATIDPLNEGVVQIKGDYNINGEMRATLNGWRGKILPSTEGSRYGEKQPDPVLVTGATPQEVIDALYDQINGPGAADLTRAEVAAGRVPAPEVPLGWAGVERGTRIRLTDPETNEQFDAYFLSQYAASSYGDGRRTVYFVPDNGGEMPDWGQSDFESATIRIDANQPLRPAAPRAGEEGDDVADHDDDVLDDYEPDPFAVPVIRDGQDFRPNGVEDMAPAGKRAKLNANMDALRTLRTLQAEGRAASPEEQSVLARWAGWGGLPEVFDPLKPEYATERAELEGGLLAPSEIREARRNTLNAHYTDARVVQAVWDAVEGLGFDGGRVLEPGSGSGTFIGLKPQNTDMVGVELDSTTAAVSKYLYPSAMIRNESFAETNMPDGAFDAAVGNVPFGRFALTDPTHNPDGHSIHNHFILKSLALTRPGGIVASLTSRYTLDSLDPSARQAIAEVADLVGAVRLPNGSHRRTAETDVIEDVLIFRKRLPGETPQADQSWVTSTKREINGWNVGVNDYFMDRPENVLGELTAEKGQFGGEVRVKGDRDMPDLSTVLNAVVADAQSKGLTATARPDDTPLPTLIQPGLGARYEGHVERGEDGTFTIATNGAAVPIDVPTRQRDEVAALLGVRNAMMSLLDAEARTGDDTEEITNLRQSLNDRYDAYVAQYGPISRFTWTKNGSRRRQMPVAFAKDPKSDVVAALENYEPPARDVPGDVGRASKAAIFTTRAIAPRVRRTSTDDPADALTLSMDQHGYVNLPAIAKMLGTDEESARGMLGTLVYEDPPLSEDEKIEAQNAARALADNPDAAHLGDLGIGADSLRDPGRLVPAAEYLSGNVRKKLAAARVAAEADPRYAANVEALRGIVPRDLTPEEIQVNLGAAWIPAATVEQFVNDTLRIPSWEKRKAKVVHSGGSIWLVDSPDKNSPRATEQWGTEKRGWAFHNIVQTLLEQRSINVTTDGKRDLDATLAAQAKADEIQERFREWLWEDPERARQMSARYNDQFNSIALRTYDGSGRTFEGMSEEWQRKVQPHVKNAVERIVNEPTAMLAHVVGAGKTAEMVMGTAELKRLGLSRKPAVVVPNHMLEQFTREYLEIYPAAKILTAGQGMNAAERREFVARAATGDWDAVIMTQGAFEGIPMGPGQQQAYLDREMADMRAQLEEARTMEGADKKNSAQGRTVKKMEAALLRAEEALKKKLLKSKDLGVSFEQTGIDYLMVDEAHMYSNLRTLSNIQSAGTAGSDKATDLHMKMEYLRENSRSGRVATFATGTPIRNTVTQAYVMQRFLRPDLLRDAGIHSFDQWAGTFGEVVDEMELKPEGEGYRQTSRFAKFKNVPEFLRMFHTFADVKLAEDLNLPRPDLTGGQAQTIAVPRSDALAVYISELGDRADDVRGGGVDPTDDNMLKISTDGRKAALSMRLVGGEHEPGKIEAAADRVAAIYESNKDKVFADPRSGVEAELPGALQIVFLDMGTPASARLTKKERDELGMGVTVDDEAAADDWNAYDHLKSELVARGVPEDMVRYVHEAKNDAEKAEMFAAAREGRIAVLLGSSEKMGVGTNMQRRAKALHHIDAPWRPADVEQRDGRIHRQGNWHRDMGETVDIYRYVTEGSFDAYMWQTLERKAKFINQVMKGSLDVREIEDVGDTAMSYAEVKALATGNPDLLEKAKADTQVTKLSRLARSHRAAQVSLAAEVERLTNQTAVLESNAAAFTAAIERTNLPETFEIDIEGEKIAAGPDGTGRTAAGALLRQRVAEARMAGPSYGYGDGDETPIASYGGHVITVQSRTDLQGSRYAALRLQGVPYEFAKFRAADLGEGSGIGMVTRIENFVNSLERRRDVMIQNAATNRSQLTDSESRIGRGFDSEADLKAWKAKADRLNAKIQRDTERRGGADIPFDPMIDTDQHDDPRTRSSAETYVPPPEEQPTRIEVLADSLSVGARIEFVQGEATGLMGAGQIVGLRTVGKFVFVTIKGDDGKEYTRAFETDTPVMRLADPDSVTGVKHHIVKWVLELKDGHVVVEAKLFGRGKFREDLHPRDRNGRFVETGAEVRIWGGGTGRIVSIAGGGRLKVERSDGKIVKVDAGNVEVIKTSEGRDVGEKPTGSVMYDVDRLPNGRLPADPMPEAERAEYEDRKRVRGEAQAALMSGNPPIAEVADDSLLALVSGPLAQRDVTPEGVPIRDAAIAELERRGLREPANAPADPPAAPEAPEGEEGWRARGSAQNALMSGNPPLAEVADSALEELVRGANRPQDVTPEGVPIRDAAIAELERRGTRTPGNAGLDSYATSPVIMPATPGPDDAVFTGPNGERAVLAVRPDGSTVGMVLTDPANPDGARRFENPDEWAEYVDAQGWSPDEGAASVGDRAPDQPSVGDLDAAPEAPSTAAAPGAPVPDAPDAAAPVSTGAEDLWKQLDTPDEMTAADDSFLMRALQTVPTADVVEPIREELTKRAGMRAKAILRQAAADEPAVTEALTSIAAAFGGKMEGLHNRLKGESSLTRKIRDKALLKGQSLDESAANVKDAVRYTMTLDADNYTEGAQQAFDRFAELGYRRLEADNTWGTGQVYQGINATFMTEDGTKFEVQFHTPESFVAKSANHKDYEIERDPSKTLEERQAAWDRMVALQESNPIPPGVEGVGEAKGGSPRPGRSDSDAPSPQAMKQRELAKIKGQNATIDAIDLSSAKPMEAFDPAAPITDPDTLRDLDNGGSASQFLVDAPGGGKMFTPERQDLHAKIVAHILDEYDSADAPKFNVLGGGPAAGKSTIEKAMPEISEGNALINPDEIKAMFPEYAEGIEADDAGVAGFVHEESSHIAKMVQAEAFNRKVSVTLDGTGDSSASKMIAKIEAAKAAGYAVNGYYVTAETDEAVRRAQARAAKTGRGVPESVIRNTHKTVSAIFEQIVPSFDSLVLMDTQASGDGGPGMVMLKEPGGNVRIIDPDLYAKFLAKAQE